MDAICVLFLLYSHSRSSFSSVVFDFNASLIDVAPLSSMSFAVDCHENDKELSVYECNFCGVSFVLTS